MSHPEGHRQYTTIGGETLCETCAQIDAGWKECKWCKRLTPTRICDLCQAETGSDVCVQCEGEGYYECEEFDCHGEFCEGGYVDCQECDGSGTVEVVQPPGRTVETIGTGGRT